MKNFFILAFALVFVYSYYIFTNDFFLQIFRQMTQVYNNCKLTPVMWSYRRLIVRLKHIHALHLFQRNLLQLL